MCRYLIQLDRGRGGLWGFLHFRLGLGSLHHGLLEHFALEDPYLDADDAVGGLRFCEAVIDVGAERMQRHAALAVRLGTRDLGAVQTAADAHFDPERSRAHRVGYGALHRTAEHHALLELLRNSLRDEL